MGLIADAIIDPKGEAAGGFFSEMAMKQVLGDELGEIYSLDNGDFRADKLNEFVLAGMGLPDGLIPLLLSQPEDLTAPDRIQLFSWLNRGRRLTPSMISLIMGTTDASNVDLQQLYIESIVDNSKVDQLTAKMIEYVFEGGRKEDLMDLMFQSRNGFITEDSFEPDISILPKGIYPGQKLYYAHLETIGYDTCLLVDPVNRYPCGMQFGSDITPEQCASIPYCCFNPIDETRLVEDEEVQELLGDPNKGVDDIPLCYYNTFFIYYNQYSLEVQPFGNFPKPVDCPKLFRFGFNLEPDIWEYFQLTQKTSVLANDRISCGFPGITKFHCVAIRGCCYEEADIDVKCYLPLSRAEEATRIGDMDGSTVETDYQDMLGPIRAFAGD
ncbi:Oidioi.mRNA.OKI2018_I69.PAR.g9101.t1.cds [Oikopleura dioica]|uniref:Oidioi.mRNA.OKI2018_I69.PAR.g9101.t1.cds n=1 Tax=Oikopleura dioica TaxID=34765 RepID=A0ABN7RRL1_OIKDI|nr:Oidioi.mRNA.OKI2018_I69.PAR.g9101.t1.cds [Oikopleura dioica]